MHLIKDENGNLVQHGHEHTHEHTHTDGVTHSHSHSHHAGQEEMHDIHMAIHLVGTISIAAPAAAVTARTKQLLFSPICFSITSIMRLNLTRWLTT